MTNPLAYTAKCALYQVALLLIRFCLWQLRREWPDRVPPAKTLRFLNNLLPKATIHNPRLLEKPTTWIEALQFLSRLHTEEIDVCIQALSLGIDEKELAEEIEIQPFDNLILSFPETSVFSWKTA